MKQDFLYYKFSDYLKNKYGEKVYKLPVNIAATCPNRDGSKGMGGCIFCGEEGADFELLPNSISVEAQLIQNSEYISKKYGSSKFIAYFQNYSNTYMEAKKMKDYLIQACLENVVALYISTRPDCVSIDHFEAMNEVKLKKSVDITLELGLQTVNYHTLEILNRRHGLAEFIQAVLNSKKYEIETCAHYIVDLPFDNMGDVIEGAKILSALGVNQVKCHSMYILKDTKLGEMYECGAVVPISRDEYIERVIRFLEYLSPQIIVQRLIGRAPSERSLFCSWGTSWWKIRDIIETKMLETGRFQGRMLL
jgi:radical SAM protein (TIGR01212 family)